MKHAHLTSTHLIVCGELLEASFVFSFVILLLFYGRIITLPDNGERLVDTIKPTVIEKNVHDIYYERNCTYLEERFPERKHNDPYIYVRQVFYVFGGVTLMLLALLKTLNFERSFYEIGGWPVLLLSCILNLAFAYAFGFVAVVNDWWFFFPDLISSHIWQIKNGQMVLGDVLFYPMATIMGNVAILFVLRAKNPLKKILVIDTMLKILWFIIAFVIILFGITFGSIVVQGMIRWLYIPFCIGGLIFYRKYTGHQLWSATCLFILCEFFWDAVARIRGVWIFPDIVTHPELYINEIVVLTIGHYPVVWQPEMTQMAFMSGMICLVFYHLSRYMLNKE